MNYTTVNDWFTGSGVFSELALKYPDSVIAEIGGGEIDVYFKMNYGCRKLVSTIVEKSVDDVVDIVDVLYMEKWEQYFDVVMSDLGSNVESMVSIDEEDSSNRLKDVSTESKNKTSAFNDDDLVDDSENIDSASEINEDERTVNTIQKRESIQARQMQLRLINNNNMIQYICDDLSRLICLGIY